MTLSFDVRGAFVGVDPFPLAPFLAPFSLVSSLFLCFCFASQPTRSACSFHRYRVSAHRLPSFDRQLGFSAPSSPLTQMRSLADSRAKKNKTKNGPQQQQQQQQQQNATEIRTKRPTNAKRDKRRRRRRRTGSAAGVSPDWLLPPPQPAPSCHVTQFLGPGQ